MAKPTVTAKLISTRRVSLEVTKTWVVDVDAETTTSGCVTLKDWPVLDQVWPQLTEENCKALSMKTVKP
jgi:hypothetical protein